MMPPGTNHRVLILSLTWLWALLPSNALAQLSSPFLFTVTANGSSAPGVSGGALAERGLTVWSDPVTDPGVIIEARTPSNLVVRSTRGSVDVTAGGRRYATFQQLEVLRPFARGAGRDVAVGGGLRRDWSGAQTFVARVVAGLSVGGGRLDGNVVVEKTMASGRDAADVVTTVGWSRPITGRVAIGVEGIGQDLEGFWSREEADGGARLMIGPTVHLGSAGRWSATIAGGPLLRSSAPPVASDNPSHAVAGLSGHYAVLGSLTCTLLR
jgi:hypothetical protein